MSQLKAYVESIRERILYHRCVVTANKQHHSEWIERIWVKRLVK